MTAFVSDEVHSLCIHCGRDKDDHYPVELCITNAQQDTFVILICPQNIFKGL